jgi:short-subunit dehydrogenase
MSGPSDSVSKEPLDKWHRYGPWALITGASDGIGRECAIALARQGMHLVLVARRETVLTALAEQLTRDYGVACRVIAADLGTPDAAKALDDGTHDLDIGLVIAAAGFGTSGPFLSSALDNERDMLAVNCGSALALSHLFGHRFGRRFEHGRRSGLILFSSLVGFQGVPGSAHYAATKGYIQSLAEGIAPEFAAKGIDVLATAPGPVHTGFASRASMQMGKALTPAQVAAATLAALGHRTTVRPGWLSKLLGWSLATLPRWGRTRVLALIMRGMTKPG